MVTLDTSIPILVYIEEMIDRSLLKRGLGRSGRSAVPDPLSYVSTNSDLDGRNAFHAIFARSSIPKMNHLL